MSSLAVVAIALGLATQGIPAGTIVDDVKCAADPSQSYALYLPSRYTPDRAWPVLLAFPRHEDARWSKSTRPPPSSTA